MTRPPRVAAGWRRVAVLACIASAAASAQSPAAPTRDDLVAASQLVHELLRTDIANGEALYEAQQRGMSAAEGVFRLGSPDARAAVLGEALALTRRLPTLEALLANDVLSRTIGALEDRSPILTRLRQRIGRLAVSVDGVAVPTGTVRQCRVLPLSSDDSTITVGSEVQLQFLYLVSTVGRLAAAQPRSATDDAALRSIDAFLLDQVRCFWLVLPAWHWSGPFPNLRDRLQAKLDEQDPRVRRPPWFGAIVDHDLFLLAIAADLLAIRAQVPAIAMATAPEHRAMLEDVRLVTRSLVRRRVAPAAPGRLFIFDAGRWSENPSYAYAGCQASRPIPPAPCPVGDVAPDASHARRWPWWLTSFEASWPPWSPARAEYRALRDRLARQITDVVSYRTPDGRPLLRNYMDGRDGWYRLREFPGHPWGHGPSTMSGTLRYGSWARLGPGAAPLRAVHRDFCRIVESDAPPDVAFRTRWYGSASTIPDSGGVGTVDLYGRSSPFALICRLDASLGLH